MKSFVRLNWVQITPLSTGFVSQGQLGLDSQTDEILLKLSLFTQHNQTSTIIKNTFNKNQTWMFQEYMYLF